MKKIVAMLLVCLIAFSLCGCQVKCRIDGCDKKTERIEENKNLVGSGYLCEEHKKEFEEDAKDQGYDSAEEYAEYLNGMLND